MREEVRIYEGLYFQDMTLKDDKMQKMFDCFMEGVPFRSLNKWTFSFTNKKPIPTGASGLCVSDETRIYVPIIFRKDDERRKEILLHEMIHAYIHELNNIMRTGDTITQWLVIHFYQEMIEKLGKARTDDIISIVSDSYFWQDNHDFLFMLKSFDLDLLLKWPLCTTFDSDRVEILEELLRQPLDKRKIIMKKAYKNDWYPFGDYF